MCGLYGIMGPGICENDLTVLKQLAHTSVVRGEDGAGMLQGWIGKNSNNKLTYTVEKTANEVSWLLWFHDTQKGGDKWLFNAVSDNFYCGHVRAATKGIITKANAHPFDLDNVVGMHNGTLKDYNPGLNKTDSEMMFEDIQKEGLRPVLARLHPDSAYAIVMLDKKTKKFSFVRNRHRPLSCTWNKSRKVFYWASEGMNLEWILVRNGISFDKILTFSEELIHTFDPFDINQGRAPSWTLQKVKELPPVEEKKEVPVIPLQATNENIKQLSDHYSKKVENKPAPLPEQQKAKEKGEENPEEIGQKKGKQVYPRANLRFDCIGCGKKLDLLDRYRSLEIRDNEYLCEKCDSQMSELARLRMMQ